MPDGHYINSDELRYVIRGRELELLRALNITPPRRGHHCCPFPNHDDKHPSWRWDFDERRFFCTCGSGDIFDVVQKLLGCGYMDAVRFAASVLGNGDGSNFSGPVKRSQIHLPEKLKKKRWSANAEGLWASCNPISGVAREYLSARNCVIPPAEGDLRCHPYLPHPYGTNIGPAIVAKVTDAVTNEPMTLHRTWISPDGHKLFDPPRMLLAGHQVSGGIIRLWPDDKITYGLGIAEGIETALSAAHGFQPIWSTVNKSNLNKFPVLDAVAVLTILADPEEAGIAAANNCGRRWLDAEREVRIWESECDDFNDWAAA